MGFCFGGRATPGRWVEVFQIRKGGGGIAFLAVYPGLQLGGIPRQLFQRQRTLDQQPSLHGRCEESCDVIAPEYRLYLSVMWKDLV